MITYQDLIQVGEGDKERMDFVLKAINRHKSSDEYKTAKIADEYARHQNRTILQYQKMLYTLSGATVPDNWSANYKIPSNFFYRFITQENQYLLGNGISWTNEKTAERLGDDFDIKLQKAGRHALVCGVAFGFFNLDHMDVFSLLEFVPIYDEENSALAAGIRFWQVSPDKPLRATLYEMDGYTDYVWRKGEGSVLKPKRPYKLTMTYSEVDGVTIYDGSNYPSFPIVPLWGNPDKQSELVGLREQIDAYDLIKSGFANDLDDVSQIYWTISNAGGMDDIDLAQFVERMKIVRAAAVSDGEQVQAHSVEIPYTAREIILDRLRKDMYRDYMALDTEEIAGGAVTATQIEAAYEPMNNKADQYEYCIIEFVQGILKVAGVEDDPTFTRSKIINVSEQVQVLAAAGEYLDTEYVTRKILEYLGDADKAEEVIKRMIDSEHERLKIQREAFMSAENSAQAQEEEQAGDVNG